MLLLSPLFSVSSVLKSLFAAYSSLDRFAEPALVARAGARHAARQNLSPLLHERLEHVDFLVVDEVHVIDAEAADFLLPKILALAAPARSSRTSARAARTSALAAWT
jgi:hypothetical protein